MDAAETGKRIRKLALSSGVALAGLAFPYFTICSTFPAGGVLTRALISALNSVGSSLGLAPANYDTFFNYAPVIVIEYMIFRFLRGKSRPLASIYAAAAIIATATCIGEFLWFIFFVWGNGNANGGL